MSKKAAILSCLTGLLLVIEGCAARDERPDLVLIVIDTLRADHLGAYGYERPTSPILDALARDGTLFLDATSTSSWTRPAMASLFTGRLPTSHGIGKSTDALLPDVPTLAGRLAEAGYRTVGVTGNFVHVNEDSGLAAGFDLFESVPIRSPEGGEGIFVDLRGAPIRAPDGPELNERVFAALDALEVAEDAPLFLYVHFMDPHSGYLAPERFNRRFGESADGPLATSDYVLDIAAGHLEVDAAERDRLVDLYDGEIASVDDAIGALLAELERRGLARESVVFVVSDHGEEFLDHGGWFHGFTLHREQLHVPLIVRDFRSSEPGGRRPEAVDLLDVYATVGALAGLPHDPRSPGRDLFGKSLTPRPRVAQLEGDALREKRVGPVHHWRSVQSGDWKTIVDVAGQGRAYRFDRDPGERAPLALEAEVVPGEVREQVRLLARKADPRPSGSAVELTPEQREGLRALGYAD